MVGQGKGSWEEEEQLGGYHICPNEILSAQAGLTLLTLEMDGAGQVQ